MEINPTVLVHEFMTKFDSPKDPTLWEKLVREEAAEFLEAYANFLKEAADLLYVIEGLRLSHGDPTVIFNVLREENKAYDLSFDLLAHLHGSFVHSQALPCVFWEVHKSNMSKLDDDGNPVRREDGKILKGPNYKAPDVIGALKELHPLMVAAINEAANTIEE